MARKPDPLQRLPSAGIVPKGSSDNA